MTTVKKATARERGIHVRQPKASKIKASATSARTTQSVPLKKTASVN
jgi:hypothetical protein